MLWYNDPDGVKAIRDGQYETVQGGANQRLMRLVRKDGVAVA
jgi:hypothetical protein